MNKRMPALFVGHGSPMNAIQENVFTRNLARIGRELGKPKAILCVSAHWMTEGSWLTHMPQPRTIHDFYGFPQELFDVRYPAPGSPAIAETVKSVVEVPKLHFDSETWGLDHGSWAVLKHLYPEAEVPVVQLSVYLSQPGSYHYELGRRLRPLREQGVLIVGSGNIVHNLRRISWEPAAKPYDWAIEFDEWAKRKIDARDDRALATQYAQEEAGRLSVPTPEHYFPLLTILGASGLDEERSHEHESIDNASISMRTVAFGLR